MACMWYITVVSRLILCMELYALTLKSMESWYLVSIVWYLVSASSKQLMLSKWWCVATAKSWPGLVSDVIMPSGWKISPWLSTVRDLNHALFIFSVIFNNNMSKFYWCVLKVWSPDGVDKICTVQYT